MHHLGMRTTISLDDDVFQEVKAYAVRQDVALGKAVSDLVRRGLRAPIQTHVVNGFHVVELPPGSPAVSTETVKKLEAELE
jgi:Arc/MetJ family transcription regulator